MKKYNLDYFQKTKWSFILIKNNKIIYRSKKEGLQPLIFCLKYRENNLKNSLVFDKIIGRAAAFLMIHGKIKSIMTPVISRSAIREFKKNRINVKYGSITEKIMNKSGNDLCPMEKLSRNKKADEFARIIMKK
jgi:hypothetical protein